MTISPRRFFLPAPPGRARWQDRRLRLLAALAAPLALTGAVIPASAAVGSPPASHAGHAQLTTSAQGLALPGLHQASYTVTLITGDQVRLTQAGPGQYAASAVPDPATDSRVLLRTSAGLRGVSGVQAYPEAAGQLLASGQVNRGLFDVTWLAAHGDTGPAARIPVTLAYPGHPAAATLRRQAAALPGATVAAASPASGQVQVTVAASRAGAFWTALTGTTAAAAGPPASRLAGDASAVWLTGHQATTANPSPQDGPPTYPVTITYTRTTGPLLGGFGSVLARLLPEFPGFVLGVAGPAQDQLYNPSDGSCVNPTPGNPLPVCSGFQVTYQLPAGVYYAQQLGLFLSTDNSDHALEQANVDMDIPQFTVTGPTALSVNADNAVPVTVKTPQPASLYSATFGSTRHLGPSFDSFIGTRISGTYGVMDLWAVPTPPAERATIGSYTLADDMTLGAPPVTASVTAPGHQALPVLYPFYTNAVADDHILDNRFTGSQSLQLVDAGLGTAADFAKINAKGKLVLIDDVPYSCAPFNGVCEPGNVDPPQIANAQQAGAAGVLFNAGNNCLVVNGTPVCNTEVIRFSLPLEWFTNGDSLTIPDLPFAEISYDQAGTLRGLLAKGPVTISITDHGESPYLYNLAFSWEGGNPASLAETLTSRDLVAVTARYHDTQVPQATLGGRTLPVPDSPFTWPLLPGRVGSGEGITQPARLTRLEYYGSLSPSVMWVQDPSFSDSSGAGSYSTFDRPGPAGTVDWNETPVTPSPPQPSTATLQAFSGSVIGSALTVCAACRQGNTFFPYMEGVNGANPQAQSGTYGVDPANVHLYNQAGQEIPGSPVDGVLAAYTLPLGQAAYKLVVTPPGGATYTWSFTSAEPARDHTPFGTACYGAYLGWTTPCQADPLVFLRYNAFTSLANTVTAPGAHQLQVTGYHQDPTAPPVTSLKLWTSADGGKTWQQAHLTGGSGGTWTAAYTLPQLSQTDGYLSIKAQATDAADDTVSETIPDAVALAAPASGPAQRPTGR